MWPFAAGTISEDPTGVVVNRVDWWMGVIISIGVILRYGGTISGGPTGGLVI